MVANSNGPAAISVRESSLEKTNCVLMLAYAYPPQNESGAARPYRFARYLPEHGYTPYVVASSYEGGESRPNIRRVPSQQKSSIYVGVVSRLAYLLERHLLPLHECLPWVAPAFAEGSDLIRQYGIRSVISTSPPLATHVAALFLKWALSVIWIADFRDPLYGNPFRGVIYDATIERLIFRYADLVIANNDAVAEVWSRRYQQWSRKIRVIWNGYDPEEDIPLSAVKGRDYRTLTHVGSLYSGRTLTIVAQSLERLIGQGRIAAASIRLQQIGTVEEYIWESFAGLQGYGCVECTGESVPRIEALRMTGEADTLLLLDLNGLGNSHQVPAKIFEYIRTGRPILAVTSEDSPSERILRGSGVPHICVYASDAPTRVDEKLYSFLALPADLVRPSEWFLRNFDGRQQVRALVKMLQSLEKGPRC